MGLPPPFWAFAWAGGQALARYILDHPALVRASACSTSRRARASSRSPPPSPARRRRGTDVDAFAIAAIGVNAAENDVAVRARLEDLVGADEGWDVCSPATCPTSGTWPRRSPPGSTRSRAAARGC